MSNFYIDLPNPHDPKGPWIQIMSGDKESVLNFAQNVLGADEKGRIAIISQTEDEDE